MNMLGFETGTWLNEPQTWSVERDTLAIVTDAKTDFWRNTYYGFTRDSGHCLQFRQPGSFTAEIRVRGEYARLYDQAGMMVRFDNERWMKTGVEFTDGRLHLSTVVTEGKSDWSVTSLAGDLSDIRLRVTIGHGAIRVQASLDGILWPLLRLAPFRLAERLTVGPMAATPERAGLRASFSEFRCGPVSPKDLHDLS